MDPTIKQATTIIHAVQTLLEQAAYLNDEQIEHLWTIYHNAEEFISGFIDRRNLPPAAFAHYLSHDAMSPVTIVIGYAELLQSGICGTLPVECQTTLGEISEYGRILQDDLKILYTTIQQHLA